MSKKKTERKNLPSKTKKAEVAQKKLKREPSQIFLLCIIVIATILVYGSSLKNEWTNWDDPGYVLQNKLIKSVDLKSIFSTYEMGNYHPVTVLMQAIEYHFFSDSASGFHTVSLLLHIINALLLFYAILLLTKNAVTAFLCSILFAIHPLHVESVAWVSAQKDLLYTGFYFAAIIFYLKFISGQRKKISFYIAALIAFILSNLSKAQAVTLPVILLFIDFYLEQKINLRSIVEKIPFFILSFIFGIIAIIAQKESASIQEIQDHSFLIQLLFAAFAFVTYVIKTFLPINLSAYYPFAEKAGGIYPFYIYTAPVIVCILAFLVFRFRKRIPSLFFGAAFFTVNIFLVLQLLPVGGAVMADRYTYLSSTGIFFPLTVLFTRVWEKKIYSLQNFSTPFTLITAGWLIFLGYQCNSRSHIWKTSETLWTDVIKKYPRVPLAQNNLGSYYQKHDQLDLAKKHFDEALRLQPDFLNALTNRSDYYRTKNQIDSALIDGNHAVHLDPQSVDARLNRGIAYAMANKLDSARHDFQFVIAHEPDNARVLNNLGNLLMMQNQPDSAIHYYNAALRVDPNFLDVLNNRGKCYVRLGNYQQAIADLTRAIQNAPTNANNYYFRMQAYEKLGKKKEALEDANRAMSLGMSIPENELKALQP
ncbi:MAG TPA: tetratricopeptide repeat protein [Chitinophagales bacterium]|nr:tetratricopeptide repeat protein [Chitinophagales bacterium]